MITIEGIDRLSAYELKEMAQASGETPDYVVVETAPSSGMQAGELGTVTAVIAEYGPQLALLLAAWIAAKKSFRFQLKRETPDGEKKTLEIKYEQESLSGLVKQIKEFLS